MERLRDGDRVLTGHRVDDEERVVRLHGRRDLAHLLHHLVVDGETTGGVDDDDVAADASRLGNAAARDRDRIGRLAEDGHVDLAAEGAQLLDRGRALQVGADEHRVATLRLEPAGELGRRRSSCPSPAGRP